MASKISHTRIAPFGVEATVDDVGRLDEADKQELRRLYALDGLLLIRGQNMTDVGQDEFCKIFGPTPHHLHDTFVISNVEKDGLLANMELVFHHDIAYVPVPFLAGCLHALQTTPDATPTRFANGFRAYEKLPQKLRARIDGLNVIFVRPREGTQRSHLTDCVPGDNCAVHGLVGRQAGTGRPYLFVDVQSTACIIGMPEADSEALLQELFSYLYADENVYAHRWISGDIVLWDNRALQHARDRVETGVRTLRRSSVNLLSYDQQYPADSLWFSDLQTESMESRSAAA